MILRAAAPDDYAAIRACIDAAFGQPDEGALVDALRECGDDALELVAATDERIAGYIMLSKLAAPQACLALAPVCVAPEFQKQGIGGALIREAIEKARAHGALAVFLLGEPAYYSRFGFSRDAAARFDTIYPKDYTMALELAPGALARLPSKIDYASVFRNL